MLAAMSAPVENAALFGWARAGQGLTTLQFAGAGADPLVAGDELVYVGDDAGSPVFVRQTASSTKTFPFPLSDLVANVSDATSDAWVALRSGSPERTFIAAPNAGAKHVKAPALLEGGAGESAAWLR